MIRSKLSLKVSSLLFVLLMVSTNGYAADAPTQDTAQAPKEETVDLEKELESLNLPDNKLPAGASVERLYSVQSRYNPLGGKHEISLGGARLFNADNFISNQINLTYRFHFSNDWSVALGGSMVFNSFSSLGERLYDDAKLAPDLAYAKFRTDLMANYNLLYGKFRLSMEEVLYFDVYLGLGGSYQILGSGATAGAAGDIGFVFWLGKWGSVRLGLKDHYYKEVRQTSSGMTHNLLGHLDFGVLL